MMRLLACVCLMLLLEPAEAGKFTRGLRGGAGTLQMTITAPLTGTPTAYHFAIGTTRGGPYTVTYQTSSAATLTHTFTGLGNATWYGVVASVNASGVGEYGPEITKTIP